MIGPLVKAALIEYVAGGTVPTTNACLFQINPEKVTHSWTQPDSHGAAGTEASNPLAVPGAPSETFSFTTMMDADDGVTSTLATDLSLSGTISY